MTSERSKLFYKAIPDLEERQERVLGCITQHENVSANDIARIEKMKPGNVRCRIDELLDRGVIIRTGKKKDHRTGRNGTTYAATEILRSRHGLF